MLASRNRFPRLLVTAVLLLSALPLAAARGADNRPASLRWVPADAAFYSSSLRMREQLNILLGSRAWAKLMQMPGIAMGRQMAMYQLNNAQGPMATVRELMESPENQELLDLAKDMFSQEVAVYGDAQWAPFAELMLGLINSQRFSGGFAKIRAALDKDAEPADQFRAQARMYLEILKDEDLKIPATVWAFQISDKKRAQRQLERLETSARRMLDTQPQLKDRLARIKVGKASFLSLTLESSLLPWDKVDLSRFEETPGEYDKLIEKLKALTLNLSIGVRGSFLLVSLGPTSEHLPKLGTGKLLAGAESLGVLQKFSDRRLTGVAYVSKPFNEAVGMRKEDLDRVVELVPDLLKAGEISEDVSTRLMADLKQVAEELKRRVPTLGDMLSLAFLTDRGYEGYTFNHSQNLSLDSSAPLELLNHVGGQPLLAVVGHRKHDPAEYDTVVKWFKTAMKYVDEILHEKLPQKELQEYERGMQSIRPLAARLDKITREKLSPSMSSGEAALVLDAKILSKKWQKDMPEADKPLPMVEPAIVLGVSDAKLLKEAVEEYATAIVKFIRTQTINEKARQPNFELPPVSSKPLGPATMYWYPLPPQAGLDPHILPHAGLSKNLAVLGTSPDQTSRILNKAPLADSQLISKTDRPIAVAIYIDFAGILKAVSPWVDYGTREFMARKAAASSTAADDDSAAESDDDEETETEEADDENDDNEAAESDAADQDESSGESDTADQDESSDDSDDSDSEKERAKKAQPAKPIAAAKRAPLPAQAQFILSEVQGILEVLQALRTIESVTYVEGDVTVTHSATYFKDLEE